MAIPTSRTNQKGIIHIDQRLCSGCGLCVKVCSDNSLTLLDGFAIASGQEMFGCVGCGHCMAVCPKDAIYIQGRELPDDACFELPSKEKEAGYEVLHALLVRRRSIRHFLQREVDNETIEKILQSAVSAPMGLPPSDVHVLVIKGKDKNRAFARDYVTFLESYKWMVSSLFLTLMRPFWGKTNAEMFAGFIRPLFDCYIQGMKKDENLVTYDAPLMMYFYGSPYCDPADPIVAATYAMLAGQSLGLGNCMLGGIHPMIQYGKKGRRFREKYGIKYPSREGLFVVFGYPAIEFRKGIHRSFADISYL